MHLKLILISISPLGSSNGSVNIVTSASPFLGTDMTCGRFFIYNLNLFIQILLPMTSHRRKGMMKWVVLGVGGLTWLQ